MSLVGDFILINKQTNQPQPVATLVKKTWVFVSYSLDVEVSFLTGKKVWEVGNVPICRLWQTHCHLLDHWVSNTDAHWNHRDLVTCRFWLILRFSWSFCISNTIPMLLMLLVGEHSEYQVSRLCSKYTRP